MARIRVLDQSGDTTTEWDTKLGETTDQEALRAIREAERIFEQQRSRGATAFKMEAGKPPVKLETFDRTAEEIVMVPRLAGG